MCERPFPTFHLLCFLSRVRTRHTHKYYLGAASVARSRAVPHVREAVARIVAFLQSELPPETWAGTPVFLYATGGLRSLPGAVAERILDEAREELSRSPFRFERTWATMITGEMVRAAQRAQWGAVCSLYGSAGAARMRG